MNQAAKEKLLGGAKQLGIELTAAQLGKFHLLADELQKWNKKINLTAIRGDEEIVVKHFLDSLTLLRLVGAQGALLDIGSGAGFPGIPVKIVRHDLQVISVDAVDKKVIFQRHAARALALHGFEGVHARAEELAAKYAGRFDWVVSRAFSDIPTFARIALPLVRERGKIVAMKGKSGEEEAMAAAASLDDLGLKVSEVIKFALPYSGDSRSFVVIEKIMT